MKRTIALLGTGALLMATAAGAQTRTTGSGIRVTKDVPAATTTPSTTSMSPGEVSLGTEFNLAAYANLNEKNITAIMAGGDSLEIQMSELALSKATSQAVRDYASMLLNDHRAHLAKTIEIITDEDVGAEPPPSNPEGARMKEMLARLRTMSAGTNWDAEFVKFQVTHHQNVIDLLTPNIKNAHDDDLEAHIEATLTSLAKHRDHGKTVGHGLGIHSM